MIHYYDLQPIECRQPLPFKDLSHTDWYKRCEVKSPHVKRVLFFDPSDIYERINAGKLPTSTIKRINTLYMDVLFPSIEGKCSCGCGLPIKKPRIRWATETCSDFAYGVWSIIAGRNNTIRNYIFKYYGECCVRCGIMDGGLEIDHKHPVYKGGGLCWLSNLEPLCVSCHKKKSKEDNKKQLK